MSTGTLAPALAPDVLDYTVAVGLLAGSFAVTPEVTPPDATIRVDGEPVASGSASPTIPLALGGNPMTIEVTRGDGLATRVYTVVVNRAPTVLQRAYGKASNTGEYDNFGWVVSLSGDTLAIGAPYENSSATGIDGNQADESAPSSGAVYVFVRTGSTWSQQAYLKASNTGTGDVFGWAVSLSGETLAVGAPHEASSAAGVGGDQADDSAADSGAVYVFVRTGTSWSQQAYLKASNTGPGDSFGMAVSLSGETLAVGAPFEDSSATGPGGDQADDSAIDPGAAYVFTRAGVTWTQEAYLKASNTDSSDYFGASVSLSGDSLAVGAWSEDSGATGIPWALGYRAGRDAGGEVRVRRGVPAHDGALPRRIGAVGVHVAAGLRRVRRERRGGERGRAGGAGRLAASGHPRRRRPRTCRRRPPARRSCRRRSERLRRHHVLRPRRDHDGVTEADELGHRELGAAARGRPGAADGHAEAGVGGHRVGGRGAVRHAASAARASGGATSSSSPHPS